MSRDTEVYLLGEQGRRGKPTWCTWAIGLNLLGKEGHRGISACCVGVLGMNLLGEQGTQR